MRELEKAVGTLQDAKAIAQEVITTQAKQCHGLQDTVEQLIMRIANKQEQGDVSEQLCGAQLLAGVKPRQSFLTPNVGHEGFKIMTDLIVTC